jgi:predicted RNase H-like HicB family nuclease
MIASGTQHIRADAPAEEPAAQLCNSLRQVLLIRGEGRWVAECPSLPGCTGDGSTREAAIASVREAMVNYLADLAACGLPVPEERFDAWVLVL